MPFGLQCAVAGVVSPASGVWKGRAAPALEAEPDVENALDWNMTTKEG